MKYEKVLKDLPIVRENLGKVTAHYHYDSKYIGIAIGYLGLLEDVLKEIENKDNE